MSDSLIDTRSGLRLTDDHGNVIHDIIALTATDGQVGQGISVASQLAFCHLI